MKVSILCYYSLQKFVRKTDKKVLSSIKQKVAKLLCTVIVFR